MSSLNNFTKSRHSLEHKKYIQYQQIRSLTKRKMRTNVDDGHVYIISL